VGLLLLGGIAALVCVCCIKRRKKGGGKGRRGKSKGGSGKGRAGEASGDAGDLPEGWEELEDGDGHKYYYNELTETTSWTRPRSKQKGSARTQEVAVKPPLVGPGIAGGVLPAEWEEHQDEDGTPYFFNARTRRTTWSRPQPSNGFASAHV